ncbi:hypothetical protein P170DRAFT_95935 [Aspergillus steynii IBT 23096]|uniref:Uncharacterized protein n=1 Tax=Aspergillus steynii IBT 23096 TaxID=1392250 RepID=A0A2I2GGU2_9EURO|nr:uncharacterized protein P170DRAFT_95935 [Aspergillus steynii IBT 23096]PLB52057.1 hypothetical protein P170DRAFT_95935 [Aspergillus steynii IBT 23096]
MDRPRLSSPPMMKVSQSNASSVPPVRRLNRLCKGFPTIQEDTRFSILGPKKRRDWSSKTQGRQLRTAKRWIRGNPIGHYVMFLALISICMASP